MVCPQDPPHRSPTGPLGIILECALGHNMIFLGPEPHPTFSQKFLLGPHTHPSFPQWGRGHYLGVGDGAHHEFLSATNPTPHCHTDSC